MGRFNPRVQSSRSVRERESGSLLPCPLPHPPWDSAYEPLRRLTDSYREDNGGDDVDRVSLRTPTTGSLYERRVPEGRTSGKDPLRNRGCMALLTTQSFRVTGTGCGFRRDLKYCG